MSALWPQWNPYVAAALWWPTEWGEMNAMDEPERPALTCSVCRFEMAPDDVAIPGHARSICLRCYHRETGSAKPMDKHLRMILSQVVNEAPN